MGQKTNFNNSNGWKIPMVSTDETLRDLGIPKEKITWTRMGNQKVKVALIDVANRKIEKAYKRPMERENKRRYREGRCLVPGKKGKLIRCPDSNKCRECELYLKVSRKDNDPLSLSDLLDYKSASTYTKSFEDEVIIDIIEQYLVDFLSKTDPILGQVFHLRYLIGKRKYIAAIMGITPDQVSEYTKKYRKILKPVAREFFPDRVK